jgi:hypothetical protein
MILQRTGAICTGEVDFRFFILSDEIHFNV